MNTTDSYVPNFEFSWENMAIGIAYCFAAAIVICLYIPCIMAFLDKDLRSIDAYVFMLHMGVCDMAQAAMHFVAGILMIIPYDYTKHSFDWFFGGVLGAAWEGYILLSAVLAVNRFVQMALPTKAAWLFSLRLIKLYITLVYLYILAWLVVFLSQTCKYIFFKDYYVYFLDRSMPQCETAIEIDAYITDVSLVIMAICYIGTVIAIRSTLKEIRQRMTEQNNIRRHEIRTTLQLAVLFVLHLILMKSWSIVPQYVIMTPYHYLGENFLWIILNGSNPFIYLLFNPTVRSKVIKRADNTIMGTTTVQQVRPNVQS